MEKRLKAELNKPSIGKNNNENNSLSDEDFHEEEIDEVNECCSNNYSPRKKNFTLRMKTSNDDLTTIANTPTALVQDTNEDSENPKKGTKLRKRAKVCKRGSMTDIDFFNRKTTMQEIKDSTRKIVAFTLKNLDKEKPIQHFKNEHYVFEDKEKEFEFYYDVKESLGEGTSSFVKKCVNKETGQTFAVKVFRAYDDEYVNFAKNEFNNMKSVDSDSVAKVYEMFYDQNNFKIYTVMEYCPGVTLMRLIRDNGAFPGK